MMDRDTDSRRPWALEVGHRVLGSSPLPHRPRQWLEVICAGFAPRQAPADHRPGRDHRAEGPHEVREQVEARPGGLDLLQLVPERLEQPPGIPHSLLGYGVRQHPFQGGIEGQSDPHSPGLSLREPGVAPGRRGSPVRVPRLVAFDQVEQLGCLSHGPGQDAVHGEEALTAIGSDRDAAAGGLQPHEPAAGSRDPGRAAAVVAVRNWDHARGHRRRGPTARAARGAVERPRIAGRPVAARLGRRQDPHLRQSGLADDHEPGGTKPPHEERVVSGREVSVQIAAQGERHPLHRPVVLDGDRHSGERARVAWTYFRRRGQRRLVRDVREGVDLRLELVDPLKRG